MHGKTWHVAHPALQCCPLANVVTLNRIPAVHDLASVNSGVTGQKLVKFTYQMLIPVPTGRLNV